MSNITFNYSDDIIRDVYNTPEEAQQASEKLGCSGYRVYTINGVIKYVPCSNYFEYERALRLGKVQGVIGAFGSDTFGDKLVGKQFASKNDINGDPYFTMGNFTIRKSEEVRGVTTTPQTTQIKNAESVDDFIQRNFPVLTSQITNDIIINNLPSNLSVDILFDKTKLENYVLFSSLKERFKNALIEISNTFPASLNIRSVSNVDNTITNYSFFELENRSTFNIEYDKVFNPFNINLIDDNFDTSNMPEFYKFRDFKKNFKNYVLYYNGIEYDIVTYNSNNIPNNFNITIQGNPFGGNLNINDSANISFYIKLKNNIIKTYKNSISDLASFLLQKDGNQKYRSEFTYNKISDKGKSFKTKETVFFPMLDQFNIDMISQNFVDYVNNLNKVADFFDTEKTNLISRFLTTESLKEYDTEDKKFNLILQLIGKNFDKIKKYIDGITFMRNISYNKIENIPDLLIKNYAQMLGHNVIDVEDEDTLIQSIFNIQDNTIEDEITLPELDIELWRRILINTFYLFKSKGTRKSIDFILKLIGLPEDIFEVDEYIYLANKKLDVVKTLNKLYEIGSITDEPSSLLNLVPFDNDGYPTIPVGISFQEDGGFIYENKKNIGPYDYGLKFIEGYEKIDGVKLFTLDRVVDGKKSWVYYDNNRNFNINASSYTKYYTDNDNLVINSKELDVFVSTDRIFDLTIYRQYIRNILIVNVGLSNQFNVNDLTFKDFLNECVTKFINPINRKTITTYPSLSKIYFDYLQTTNNPVTNLKSLTFLNKFDSSWIRLIEQYIPATSILNAGKKISNSKFLDNKYKYRHGENNKVSWVGTDGSEFQEKALVLTLSGKINGIDNIGETNFSFKSDDIIFTVYGKQSGKYFGVDYTIKKHFSTHYSLNEYCSKFSEKVFIWDDSVDYSDPIFGGNINTADINTPRYGVFVIHNNLLYRLNTNLIVNDGLNDITVINVEPPKGKVNGVDVWDYIPFNSNVNTITFKDSSYWDVTEIERLFYVDTISIALAYINQNINYDCPPPKPHVCYHDYNGKLINLNVDSINYVDNLNNQQQIKQPKFYGYSKNYSFLRPDNVNLGLPNKWADTYKKQFNWIEGDLYYKDEIIALFDANGTNLVADSNVYIVTGDVFQAETSTFPETPIDGLSLLTVVDSESKPIITGGVENIGGMYELFEDRKVTDPFMHVDPALITKINLNPNLDTYSINLTKSINLSHIFSGDTQQTTYKVVDNIIDNTLFISDNITLDFDGFYPVKSNNIGPFYDIDDENIFIHTLNENLTLFENQETFISIQSLNDNFNIVGNDLSLVGYEPSYYLITSNSFISFEFTLFFNSINNVNQQVVARLKNSLGFVYDTQVFNFSGDDSAENRVFTFNYYGFFRTNEKIYFSLESLNSDCLLSRYEVIEYDHDDTEISDYNILDDPRFRILFNNGVISDTFVGEGLSIKPIYNSSDLVTKPLILGKTDNKEGEVNITKPIPLISNVYPNNLNLLYTKMYNDYYTKFTDTELNTDYAVSDQKLNYDVVDFTFTIRSKSTDPIENFVNVYDPDDNLIQTKSSKNGIPINREVSFNNYFLGNTPPVTEFFDASVSISIGKTIKRKLKNFNREINIYESNSFFGSNNIDKLTITGVVPNFSELSDINYNFNILNEIRDKKRHVKISGDGRFYYTKNSNINNQIYSKLIDIVPEYDPYINNYVLNDIIKYKITDYPVVIESEGGYIIENRDVYKLYVCINDIHKDHLIKALNDNNVIEYLNIHEIYSPKGVRSCFVEIEKYNPANFTPWGYEHERIYNIPNHNINDYIGKISKEYKETEELDFEYGDIIISNLNICYDVSETGSPQTVCGIGDTYTANEFFKFIYPKSLKWVNNKYYNKGEHVYHPVTIGSNTYYRFFTAKEDILSTTPPSDTNPSWYMHTNNTLFKHQSIDDNLSKGGVVDGVPSLGGNPILDLDDFVGLCTTVAKFPKTIPIRIDNNVDYINKPIIFKFDDDNHIKSIMKNYHFFSDIALNLNDNNETNNCYKIFRSKGNLNMYDGITVGSNVVEPYILTDKYFNAFSREGVTNIYLKPTTTADEGNTNDSLFGSRFTELSLNETLGIYPLFERLTPLSKQNNPKLWSISDNSGGLFDERSLYLGNKYMVDRGVLYRYNDTEAIINTTEDDRPSDSDSWVENDFCLVNKFKFYKDRVSVKVYESKMESLTDEVKDDLHFFNKNLRLKTLNNGFSSRSFNGDTVNEKLFNGLDLLYNVKDHNRRSVQKYGITTFRRVNNDLIMDYHVPKNEIGHPLTGEFLGMLKITNPCGHSASTIIGILFDTDLGLVDKTLSRDLGGVLLPQVVDLTPYIINVVVNQTAQSNANIEIGKLNNNGEIEIINDVVNRFSNYSKNFEIIPETEFYVKITYDTSFNESVFNSAKFNNLQLFLNDQTINTNMLKTEIIKNNQIETRIITVKHVNNNSTIIFNIEGIEITSTDNVNKKVSFDVKNINIKNSSL